MAFVSTRDAHSTDRAMSPRTVDSDTTSLTMDATSDGGSYRILLNRARWRTWVGSGLGWARARTGRGTRPVSAIQGMRPSSVLELGRPLVETHEWSSAVGDAGALVGGVFSEVNRGTGA